MPRDAHVFLIPGFFGIANVGQPRYFEHVRRELDRHAAERGQSLRYHEVTTHPTSSLIKRAARLAAAIESEAGDDTWPIHLIGHSTGAIDARMWMALPELKTDRVQALRRRVRSMVSIAGAHRGTPSAAFFASFRGHHLLRVLSTAAAKAIRGGALDTSLLRRLASTMAPDAPVLLLDQVYRDVVSDLDGAHRDELGDFFSEVASDGSLLPQLAPASMEVIDALLGTPDGVRCGCVVAAVPARDAVKGQATGPRYRASLTLFGELHRIAARAPEAPPKQLTPLQVRKLALGSGNNRSFHGWPWGPIHSAH